VVSLKDVRPKDNTEDNADLMFAKPAIIIWEMINLLEEEIDSEVNVYHAVEMKKIPEDH
jgi:hypothetical protein